MTDEVSDVEDEDEDEEEGNIISSYLVRPELKDSTPSEREYCDVMKLAFIFMHNTLFCSWWVSGSLLNKQASVTSCHKIYIRVFT